MNDNLLFEDSFQPKGNAEVRAIIAQGKHGTRTVLDWWDLTSRTVADTLDVDIADEYLADAELPGKGIWTVDFHMKFVTYPASPNTAEEYDDFVIYNSVRPATRKEIALAIQAEPEEEPLGEADEDALSVLADGFPHNFVDDAPDDRIIYWACRNYTVPEHKIRAAIPVFRKMSHEERAQAIGLTLEKFLEFGYEMDWNEWEDMQFKSLNGEYDDDEDEP